MPEFHETRMGHRYYESTLPRIAQALERIADGLEKANVQQNEMLQRAIKAIDDEPELTDSMPQEMFAALQKDRDSAEAALRIVVKLTKESIKERLVGATNASEQHTVTPNM